MQLIPLTFLVCPELSSCTHQKLSPGTAPKQWSEVSSWVLFPTVPITLVRGFLSLLINDAILLGGADLLIQDQEFRSSHCSERFSPFGCSLFTLQSPVGVRDTKCSPFTHFSSFWAIASLWKRLWSYSSHSNADFINKLGSKYEGACPYRERGKGPCIFRSTLINCNYLVNLGRNGVSFQLNDPGNLGCELWYALIDTDYKRLIHY